MLASLEFAFPMMLAAAAAAAAPVIIHLVMRTRPRPVVFPALRFVRKTHHANLSKLRLKQLILLLMRMAMIVLTVLLLARGLIPDWQRASAPAAPTVLAIVIDNSGSMGYRRSGKSLLDHAKRAATLLGDRLPKQSRVAVFCSSDPKRQAAFLADRKITAQQIWDIQPTDGDWALGAAVAEAVAAVQNAPLETKRVCVLTDMTAQGWRELPAVRGADNVAFDVVNCMEGENLNMSLGPMKLSSHTPTVSSDIRLESSIHSSRIGDHVKLRVELDGREVQEESHKIVPGVSSLISLVVTPHRSGAVHGRVILDYDDPLAMDNVRYFTLQVAGAKRVLILRDPTTMGSGDRTTLLMSTAISPSLNRTGRQWLDKVTMPADRMAAEHLDKVDLVLMPNVSSLSASQWRVLEEYVYDGGRLWVVAGPLMSTSAHNTADARRLMPVVLGAQQELASPIGWQTSPSVHPMLQPFLNDENPPLSSIRCSRRMGVERIVPGSQVILRYSDSVPAIALRQVGRGYVLLWNFSPAGGMSNMTSPEREKILPILAKRTASVLMGRAQITTMHLLGESVTQALPPGAPTAVATLIKTGSQAAGRRIAPDVKLAGVTVTPGSAGNWNLDFAGSTVTAGRGEQIRMGFSVNVRHTESDMTPMNVELLRDAFPSGRLSIADSIETLRGPDNSSAVSLELAIPVFLVLLVLMTGESFFSNRFYRRRPENSDESEPSGDAQGN